ncbi:hypothetical protein [Cellulomonas sp. URHB0016]
MVRRNRAREARAAMAPTVSATGHAATTVPTTRREISSEEEARALAAFLLTPGRRWPVAVVTIASGALEPFADVDALVQDLRGLVEVVVMPTSDVSWAFSSQMPSLTQVYGGASRVYPVDHGWVSTPRRAPLRFAYAAAERDRVTEDLVADGMAAAVAAGLYEQRSPSLRPVVGGEVVGVLGSRAIVQLDHGGMATLWEELSGFDVPLDRLVRRGQRVQGQVDPETRRLDLRAGSGRLDGAAAGVPSSYVAGATVLAEVVAVREELLTVRVVVGADVDVPRSAVTTNGLDRLDELFTPGDVVVARMASSPPMIALSLLDVDDEDAPVLAPALLDGGPAWLVPPPAPEVVRQTGLLDGLPDVLPAAVAPVRATGSDHAAAVDPLEHDVAMDPVEHDVAAGAADLEPPAGDAGVPRRPTPLDLRAGPPVRPSAPAPEAAVPAPREGTAVRDLGLALATERARVAELTRGLDTVRGAARELARLRQYAASLEAELDASERNQTAFRDKYRHADARRQWLEAELKAASRGSGRDDDTRGWFTDPELDLRYAVTAAWARRVPAGEKARWPLGPWQVGPRLVDSLTTLGPVAWSKLAEVVADVVVGDPARLAARENHELRERESGSAPAVTRADGAVCYRVALQRNTPSARRLHYWRRGDLVELSRVVLHDDTAP